MNKTHAKKSMLGGVLYISGVLAIEYLILLVFNDRPDKMAVGFYSYILWALVGLVAIHVEGRLPRLLVPVSFAVFLVGNLNSVASYYHYGNYFLTELSQANIVYSAFVLVFACSVLFFDKKLTQSIFIPYEKLRTEKLNTVFFIFALLFPFVWFLDELITLKRIPLFSGESITENIYTTEYGKLYGYGVLLAVSALIFMSKFRSAIGPLRLAYAFMIAFSMLAMIFDGRRVFLLIFIAGALSFHLASTERTSLFKPLLKVSLLILVAYIAVLYQRQGGDLITHFSAAQVFSKVGVEYRDFALLFSRFLPGAIEGYSWLGSSFGGFGNKFVLFFMGLNKGELVFSGSAYQIGLTLKSNFGIRIGLFPEIWLQYGLLGLLFCPLVALLFVWISRLVDRSTSEAGRALSASAFGVVILSFVGQSSAITGYWSLLLYLYLAWRFLEAFRYDESRRLPGESYSKSQTAMLKIGL